MAKKKKNSSDDFNDMLMSVLDDMLNSLSPDMKDKLVDKMNEYAAEGKDMIDIRCYPERLSSQGISPVDHSFRFIIGASR